MPTWRLKRAEPFGSRRSQIRESPKSEEPVLGFGKKIDLDKDGKREALQQTLESIAVPALAKTLGELKGVGTIEANKNGVEIQIRLPTLALSGKQELLRTIEESAERALGGAAVQLRVESGVRAAASGRYDRPALPGIQNVVLVASGKGGVGKSTVATNLAVALSKLGCRVGLLDADVYGPSLPTMFGFVDGTRPGTAPGQNDERPKIMPLERHGIKLMSLGFLVDTSTPMVWRGPMIASAAMQLFRDVVWGELDYLVVDLPPGTGDIHLTISQQVTVAGSVIVSTPQDVALADVIRAKSMFDKVSIPSLGIVENMSYFICANCDTRHEIFFHGGAQKAAAKLEIPFLGEIPLEQNVMKGGDHGSPVVLAHPDSASAAAFVSLAERVATDLADMALREEVESSAPTISISGAPNAAPAEKKKGGLPIIG